MNGLQIVTHDASGLIEPPFLLMGCLSGGGANANVGLPSRTPLRFVGLAWAVRRQADQANDFAVLQRNARPRRNEGWLNVLAGDVHNPFLRLLAILRQAANVAVVLNAKQDMPSLEIEQRRHFLGNGVRMLAGPLKLQLGALPVANHFQQLGLVHDLARTRTCGGGAQRHPCRLPGFPRSVPAPAAHQWHQRAPAQCGRFHLPPRPKRQAR